MGVLVNPKNAKMCRKAAKTGKFLQRLTDRPDAGRGQKAKKIRPFRKLRVISTLYTTQIHM